MKKHLILAIILIAIYPFIILLLLTPTADFDKQIFNHVNSARDYEGLEPLEYSVKNQRVAELRQYTCDRFTHDGFGLFSFMFFVRAELLARGYEQSGQIVVAWDNSPDHQKAMLGEYKKVGIYTDKCTVMILS